MIRAVWAQLMRHYWRRVLLKALDRADHAQLRERFWIDRVMDALERLRG